MQKISIITPFYKGNQFLENLFSTVQANQEYLEKKNFRAEIELVLVNDSPEVEVKIPEKKFDFVYRIVSHSSNQGIHQARVTGLKCSMGDYILFLDQDDEIKEAFIYEQLLRIEDADVIVANAFLENENGEYCKFYKTEYDLEKIRNIEIYLKSRNQIASPGQCIIRKTSIPDEWKQMIVRSNGADDLFLWLLMLAKKRNFTMNPTCLYIHKYTGENLSASKEKMNYSSLEVVNYMENIREFTPAELKVFKRSIDFNLSWMRNPILGKMKLIFTNADILIMRVIWKINRIWREITKVQMLKLEKEYGATKL